MTREHQKKMFCWRVSAFVLDYVVVFMPYIVILILVSVYGLQRLVDPQTIQRYGQMVGLLTVTLPLTLYYTITESLYGASLGKRWMGLHVVTSRQTSPTLARSMLRNVLKFIPWELAHTIIWYMVNAASPLAAIAIVGNVLVYVLLIYYLITLIRSPDHQTAYDQWARLYVTPHSTSSTPITTLCPKNTTKPTKIVTSKYLLRLKVAMC